MPWFIVKYLIGLQPIKAMEPNNQSQTENNENDSKRIAAAIYEKTIQTLDELEKTGKDLPEPLMIIKVQEITKQLEKLAELKEYELAIELAKTFSHSTAYEEIRKTSQEETLQFKLRMQYEDSLYQNRQREIIIAQEKLYDDYITKLDASYFRQDIARRNSIEHEIKLRNKYEKNIIEAKARAKIDFIRKKTHLAIEEMRAKAAEQRKTIFDTIKLAGNVVGVGIDSLFCDYTKTVAALGGISVLAFGIFAVKGTTSVAVKYIESKIGKPKLVNETSRFSIIEAFKHPILTFSKHQKNDRHAIDALSEVVFSPALEKRVRDISIATKNTRMNQAIYRNFLIYGPPGTGKTLFSKKLAMYSGMDYAIMTGGDVVSMGKEAAAAIHKLFDWANTSKNGLVLFIDEADTFLKKRSAGNITNDLRATMNAFLYRTSNQSDRFMVILATNSPNELDSAVNDRLDHLIELTLPGLNERERLISLYFDQFILKPAYQSQRLLSVDRFDYKEFCQSVATRTEGMSARSLAKLGAAWQAAAFTAYNCRITQKMCIEVVNVAIKDHIQKMAWLSEDEKYQKINKDLLKIPYLEPNQFEEDKKKMPNNVIDKDKNNLIGDNDLIKDDKVIIKGEKDLKIDDKYKFDNILVKEEKVLGNDTKDAKVDEKILFINIKEIFKEYLDKDYKESMNDDKNNLIADIKNKDHEVKIEKIPIKEDKNILNDKNNLLTDTKTKENNQDDKNIIGGNTDIVPKKNFNKDKKDLINDKKVIMNKTPKDK